MGSGFQSLAKKSRKWFPMEMLSFCRIFWAVGMSAVRQGGRRQHICVRCHSTYKTMVMVACAQAASRQRRLGRKEREKREKENVRNLAQRGIVRSQREVVREEVPRCPRGYWQSGLCLGRRFSKVMELW